MKKSTIIISILAAALLTSNAWWAFTVLDAGVTETYQGAQLEEEQQTLNQALAVLRTTTRSGASRAQIVEAAQMAWSAGEPFEKDGYTWVGRLGLKFDEQGKLIDVIRD
ncbi:hypothetical protein GCM10027343_02980 [Noviherbaspirillum agri]